MTNTEIFEEIFWQVGEENGLNSWWEIFDSEVFCEVEDLSTGEVIPYIGSEHEAESA